MKKYTFLLILAMSQTSGSYGQNDTTLVRSQSGFLFLSSYGYKYDDYGSRMRPVGFHDYFFPLSFFQNKLFSDSNLVINFKNGIRVDSIKGRNILKQKANVFNCIDTGKCYRYEKFYIIPISITYMMYLDNWPLPCKKNHFSLQVLGGAQMRFNYVHKAMHVTRYVIGK